MKKSNNEMSSEFAVREKDVPNSLKQRSHRAIGKTYAGTISVFLAGVIIGLLAAYIISTVYLR